jgi:hypothetical protein
MMEGSGETSRNPCTPFPTAGEGTRTVEPAGLRAGSSCAGGPIYPLCLGADGKPIDFAEAFPLAPEWLKRLARRS